MWWQIVREIQMKMVEILQAGFRGRPRMGGEWRERDEVVLREEIRMGLSGFWVLRRVGDRKGGERKREKIGEGARAACM